MNNTEQNRKEEIKDIIRRVLKASKPNKGFRFPQKEGTHRTGRHREQLNRLLILTEMMKSRVEMLAPDEDLDELESKLFDDALDIIEGMVTASVQDKIKEFDDEPEPEKLVG